uniref:Neuroendocrine convertase 2 n=1 Tax=Dugesia japonica TaxID=6161 RepID=A0AAU7L203_DUGJA
MKLPTDPLFSKEWYIRNTGQADGVKDLDLNVLSAWAQGITGKGVTTAIMDDGIDYLHPDLSKNYNAESSYDFSSNDPYPFPRYTDDWFNSHGTRCAGEISAERDNGICGVGVAYDSKIAGLRMLDQPYMTDLIEAAAMSYDRDNIDIYSASWGPTDDGRTVDGPRNETMRAIVEGVNKGRKGKGSIYVWASGDGGAADDCNCDGYAASMWTISINSATNDGETASYDESCSSTLASTFSNGKAWFSLDAGVGTVDLYGQCTLHHSGTSAAAPEAAGVFALALEANSNIGWRDMQHLTVLTSKRNHLHDRDRRHNWTINGAGLEFNHLFGYGVLDAGDMVRVSKKWVNVPERFHCIAGQINKRYRFNVTKALILEIDTDACKSDTGHRVNYLEHVQAFISVKASRRGDITMFLTSPMGTTSMILSHRPKDDDSTRGFTKWPFMTTHTWGENPRGKWRLTVMFDTKDPLSQGIFSEWVLVLHGTQNRPYDKLSSSLEKIIPKLGVVKRQHASERFSQ